MGIEVLLYLLGIVLFAGMLVAGYVTVSAAPPQHEPARIVVEDWSGPFADEVVIRHIEHHLRRERLFANCFVDAPSAETLRSGLVA
jgi:hypothetical protein